MRRGANLALVFGVTGAVMAAPKGQMRLDSAAFRPGQAIPSVHTCDGQDVSPPLSWSGAPVETRSLALICEDPDAPRGLWVHWVLYDLPPGSTSLPEGVAARDSAAGGTHGKNDFGRLGYGGPCPPGGTHRYFFRLYALDRKLSLPAGATRAELLSAMEGHILGQGELMGTYSRR